MSETRKPQSYIRSVQLLREAGAGARRKREIAETVRHPLLLAQQAERVKEKTTLMSCAEKLFAWGCVFKHEEDATSIWIALSRDRATEGLLLPILARSSCGQFEHQGRQVAVESELLVDADPTDDRRLFVFRQWIEGVMITSDGRLTTVHGLFGEVSPLSLQRAARVVSDGQVYLNIESHLKDEAIRLASGR